MHSLRYAEQVKNHCEMRYYPQSKYWEDRAFAAFAHLSRLMGEDAADKWFDENIPAETNWREIAEKCARKSVSIGIEEAQHPLNTNCQQHLGAR